MMGDIQKTPAAKWRQEGQADPHGEHYNCQRAALTLGELTDDELANGVFLNGNEPLNINALLRKTPGYHSAVVWLTAGKDRIRWLSRALEESMAREQALQLRLNAADQQIDELTVPAGYCLMPTRLTAENGAKALLLGEFKLDVTSECPECRDLEEPLEGCEVCDGEGEYGQQHMIPWDQIKFIYSEAVKGLAKKTNTPQ